MRKLEPSTRFERDLKRVNKYPKFDKKLLATLLNTIANGGSLEVKYKDHKLAKHSPGEYSICRCFHLAPNICIVYRTTDDAVKLIRIGSHQDLGLTENFATT